MWEGRRRSCQTLRKQIPLGTILVKVVSINFKWGNTQTSPYGVVQTFDLFASFHEQGRSLEKESLMKETYQERHKQALLPQHTSTQRLHSPMTTLKVVTS